MRDFVDIQRELGLELFTESDLGTLYCVPAVPGAPRLIVRHFDQAAPPRLVEPYAGLLAAAEAWLAEDPALHAVVRVEQPTEVGRDFIARPHHNATSLAAYLDTDDDPPEPPDELARMQDRFRARADSARGLRDALVIAVLARSILEPTYKTVYSYGEERFIIVDLKPEVGELERWAELAVD